MAMYLGKETLTITNYFHAVSGDMSGSSNRFIIKVILLASIVHIALC